MKVREPIQVYLTQNERAELERHARELGVSRSEVLRRGILAIGRARSAGSLAALVDEGLVTPPAGGFGDSPRGAPVAPLPELLHELEEDRRDS